MSAQKKQIRQTGIQQSDGVNIVKKITKFSKNFFNTEEFNKILEYSNISKTDRKGPVFLEIPIDIQAKEINKKIPFKKRNTKVKTFPIPKKKIGQLIKLIKNSKNISLLLGSGISKNFFLKLKNPCLNQTMLYLQAGVLLIYLLKMKKIILVDRIHGDRDIQTYLFKIQIFLYV